MTLERTANQTKRPTTAELLARLPELFHLSGSGKAIEPKASDLSPYKPKPTEVKVEVEEATKLIK